MRLLAAMTLAVAAGPVGIGVVLRGGERAGWPPDRAVEWAMFFGVTAAVVALLILCVALALANQRVMHGPDAASPSSRPGDRPEGGPGP
jgi:hypothetical protein